MADFFLSAKKKLDQVGSLIAALESEIDAFNATEPHERVVETDPEGLVQEHRVRLIRSLPPNLADITLDAAAALHDTLDQSVFAASKIAGSHRLLDTAFPIARDSVALDKLMEEKCEGVPPEIAQTIRAQKPYRGANDLIWGIAVIESMARKKNALIVPLGSVDSGLTFINNKTAPEVRWNAQNKEIELGFFPIHGKFHRDINIYFSAAFGQVDSLEGRPVVLT
ncbi:MAG TPA: hypothetical protein VLN73_02865, partial [Alphaproteobacteria bacterium]|nr:hypothetical protein [Alphaproteobacteria bacterium]